MNSQVKCDLCEHLLLFALSVVLHIQNLMRAFFFSAASNPFLKDHQKEEAQGASHTSAVEASEGVTEAKNIIVIGNA